MRLYELVLVARPGLGESELKKVIDNIGKWLGDAKIEVDKLGKKPLAYPIKKEREGIYLSLSVKYDNGAVVPADFEKKLYMAEEVLRHLLILRSEKSSSPPLPKKKLTLTRPSAVFDPEAQTRRELSRSPERRNGGNKKS